MVRTLTLKICTCSTIICSHWTNQIISWFEAFPVAVVVFLNFVNVNLWAAFQWWFASLSVLVVYSVLTELFSLSFEVSSFPLSVNQSIKQHMNNKFMWIINKYVMRSSFSGTTWRHLSNKKIEFSPFLFPNYLYFLHYILVHITSNPSSISLPIQ